MIEKLRVMKNRLNEAPTAKIRHELEDKIENIEIDLASLNAKKYSDTINEHVKSMSLLGGGYCANKMWTLKRKVCPRTNWKWILGKLKNP